MSAYEIARTFSDFADVADAGIYTPLPDDWLLGVTDVVNSTAAIRKGSYRSVNFAGAATLVAVSNAIDAYDFPFTFGGDGASFAIRPQDRDRAEQALADTVAWIRANLDLEMRAALIPITEVRRNNVDVQIAKYASAPGPAYTMFSGGGLRWAERQLKAGRFSLACPTSGAQPDLTGLSCNWAPLPARNGKVASILVEPSPAADHEEFARVVRALLGVLDESPRQSHPVHPENMVLDHAAAGGAGATAARATDKGAFGIPEEPVPEELRADVARNSDFRKFGDVLRLTVDVNDGQISKAETLLREAAKAGIVRFGMHCQDEALLTCFVPTGATRMHLHFLDGADGGYTRAAEQMEAVGFGVRRPEPAHG